MFPGFFAADLLRSIAYRTFRISPSFPQSNGVLVISRHGSRAWTRPNQLHRLIKQWATSHHLRFIRSDLEGYDLAAQVRQFAEAGIVVAAHGAALTNVIFMRPRTVLVECFPAFFYELAFETLASLARVHYIAVSNFQTAGFPWKINRVERLYQRGEFYANRRMYIDSNVMPNPTQLWDALDRAYAYLWRVNWIWMDNDRWSGVE